MDILYYTRYLPNCQEGEGTFGELFEKSFEERMGNGETGGTLGDVRGAF